MPEDTQDGSDDGGSDYKKLAMDGWELAERSVEVHHKIGTNHGILLDEAVLRIAALRGLSPGSTLEEEVKNS